MLFRYFIKDLYQRYDQLLLFTSLHFLISICRPTLYSITFEMSVAVTHYISHGPSISAAVYFCYKGCDIIANYRALKVLYLVRFAFTHPKWSTRLLYVNASCLASSCESQDLLWDEGMTAAGDEARNQHIHARRLRLFNLYYLFIYNFEGFSIILVL